MKTMIKMLKNSKHIYMLFLLTHMLFTEFYIHIRRWLIRWEKLHMPNTYTFQSNNMEREKRNI